MQCYSDDSYQINFKFNQVHICNIYSKIAVTTFTTLPHTQFMSYSIFSALNYIFVLFSQTIRVNFCAISYLQFVRTELLIKCITQVVSQSRFYWLVRWYIVNSKMTCEIVFTMIMQNGPISNSSWVVLSQALRRSIWRLIQSRVWS